MCQVDTSESLEDIFPGGLINRGAKPCKKIRLTVRTGSSKFSGSRQVLGCLTEAGEQRTDWVPEKDRASLESHAIYFGPGQN